MRNGEGSSWRSSEGDGKRDGRKVRPVQARIYLSEGLESKESWDMDIKLRKMASQQKGCSGRFSDQPEGLIDSGQQASDRFIPLRSEQADELMFNGEISPYTLKVGSVLSAVSPGIKATKSVFNTLLKNQFISSKIIEEDAITKPSACSKLLKFDKQTKKRHNKKVVMAKIIQKERERIKESIVCLPPYHSVDATGLEDDFYVHLLDWSQKNFIGVSLDSSVHLWNLTSNSHHELLEKTPFRISNLSFNTTGQKMHLGTDLGVSIVLDVERAVIERKLVAHDSEIGVSKWMDDHTLLCGNSSGQINLHDTRSKRCSEFSLQAHESQVCGLSWSSSLSKLASGGNDNVICIWDCRSSKPEARLEFHEAAVRGISWSVTERGNLFSGGGNADKKLRQFNILTLSTVSITALESQVTGIHVSNDCPSLVTTHGFEENDVRRWDCFDLTKPISKFEGHQNRVLYSALSPCGQKLVTGSGDETLKFWNVFDKQPTRSSSDLFHNFKELR